MKNPPYTLLRMGEFLYPEAFHRFSVSLKTSLLSHFKTYTHTVVAVGDRILVHQTKKAPILSWCFAHRKELEPFIAYYMDFVIRRRKEKLEWN